VGVLFLLLRRQLAVTQMPWLRLPVMVAAGAVEVGGPLQVWLVVVYVAVAAVAAAAVVVAARRFHAPASNGANGFASVRGSTP
jgi:hypothetical protein